MVTQTTQSSKEQYSKPTHLFTQFTKRDMILYALGIGCCSQASSSSSSNNSENDDPFKDRELRYVYENHPEFEPFPTFLLSLTFQSELIHEENGSTSRLGAGIRPFPPESLGDGSGSGIIPQIFFKDANRIADVQSLPALHMRQKFTIHKQLLVNMNSMTSYDAPVNMWLESRVLSVDPRGIGTFITTETKFYQTYNDVKECIATAEMTALVLGVDPNSIRRFGPRAKKCGVDNAITANAMSKAYVFRLPQNAALIYRLSGDYNPIHVVGGSGLLNNRMGASTFRKAPVLHGLCSLGYAIRALLKYAEEAKCTPLMKASLVSVECEFVKPVFVGDTLIITISDEPDESIKATELFGLYFKVYRSLGDPIRKTDCVDFDVTKELVVDNGVAMMDISPIVISRL
jgi:hypothetical protein